MLHLAYILIFTVVAFMAISNLIRSLITVSYESTRRYTQEPPSKSAAAHPELLDEEGRPIKEPLLVMRSVSVEDARQKLESLYYGSPNPINDSDEEI